MTEEHKNKIRLSHLGKKRPSFSKEWREKLGKSMRGKKHSSESIEKMKASQRGKILSEETKNKLRQKSLGRKASDETKKKMSDSWSYEKIMTPERNAKISESLKGKNHPQWKGGIAPIGVVIRNLPESKKWREAIFDRDNYTCQRCEKNGGYLEAHHKKSFSVILKEFLEINSMFSAIEDKETLVRLSLFYPDFWDVMNGETLCKDCHKIERVKQ